jgi:hypothetical protein
VGVFVCEVCLLREALSKCWCLYFIVPVGVVFNLWGVENVKVVIFFFFERQKMNIWGVLFAARVNRTKQPCLLLCL